MNHYFRNKTVWITGASSGIGLALALHAARGGAGLCLFSSRQTALEDAAESCRKGGAREVRVSVVDLGSPEGARQAAVRALERWGVPDVLVLNAGVSQRSLALETDVETVQRIMNVNFYGKLCFGRPVMEQMLDGLGGSVAVTGSVTGLVGVPMRSAYSASKHALEGYFESLALEYADRGLRVTVIQPGYVKTSIGSNALLGDGSRQGHSDTGLRWGMDAAVCARRYWRAVERGKARKIVAGPEHVFVFLHRFVPVLFRAVGRKVARAMRLQYGGASSG